MKIKIKKITKNIFLVVLLVLLFNLIIPTTLSLAAITIDDEIPAEDLEFDGGTLLTPIKKLAKTIGDAAISLVQKILLGSEYGYVNTYVEHVGGQPSGDIWDDIGDNTIGYPAYLVLTPEAIFRNQIGILNADFVNPIDFTGTLEKSVANNYENKVDTLANLRKTIAKWYLAIRNIALVGLLSVLVYIGIRIVISSAAEERAKYKQMISAWITAICLLFLLHYIMAGTFMITEELTKLFNTNEQGSNINIISTLGNNSNVKFKFKDTSNETKLNELLGKINGEPTEILVGSEIVGVANLMQYARLYSNLNGSTGLGYAIIYVFLVFFTIWFFVKYTARFVRLAFLTLIAPLITLTYPIDKINDGQAQAFGMWLKEFIYNVLIQPFHLLIYVVFVSSALEFANQNIIYVLVILGFMTKAEELLRKMFGFERASSTGAFSGAAAGSLIANYASKLGKNAISKSTGGKSGEERDNQQDKIHGNDNPYEGLNSGDTGAEEYGENDVPSAFENGQSSDVENYNQDNQLPSDSEQDIRFREQFDARNQEIERQRLSNVAETAEEQQTVTDAFEQRSNAETVPKLTRSAKIRRGLGEIGGKGLRKLGDATGIRRGVGVKKNFVNSIKTVTPKVLKAGTEYTMAGTTAMFAGIGSLMAGDPKTFGTAIAVASTAGAKLGGTVASKVTTGVSNVSDTFARGYYGDEYNQIQETRKNDEWRNSQATHDLYKSEFGDNAEAAMQHAYEMRTKYGSTNDEDNIAALKLTSEFGGQQAIDNAAKLGEQTLSVNYAKRLPSFVKEVGDGVFDDKKKYDSKLKEIQTGFMNEGMQADAAKRQATKVLRDVAKVKGRQVPRLNTRRTTQRQDTQPQEGNRQRSQRQSGDRQANPLKRQQPPANS